MTNYKQILIEGLENNKKAGKILKYSISGIGLDFKRFYITNPSGYTWQVYGLNYKDCINDFMSHLYMLDL